MSEREISTRPAENLYFTCNRVKTIRNTRNCESRVIQIRRGKQHQSQSSRSPYTRLLRNFACFNDCNKMAREWEYFISNKLALPTIFQTSLRAPLAKKEMHVYTLVDFAKSRTINERQFIQSQTFVSFMKAFNYSNVNDQLVTLITRRIVIHYFISWFKFRKEF